MKTLKIASPHEKNFDQSSHSEDRVKDIENSSTNFLVYVHKIFI